MNTSNLIITFLSELNAGLSQVDDVRTPGGTEDDTLPLVIVDWTRRSTDDGGHSDYAGTRENATGGLDVVHHTYYGMDFDCEIRVGDETELLAIADGVDSLVTAWKRDSAQFNAATYEWESSDLRPDRNQRMAPDWYEGVLSVSCKYRTEEVDADVPTYQTITSNITLGLD